MKNKSNFKNELEMTFALQQMEKTAPEIVRFQGLWSEMGDSNSRPDGPKPPALPTALIPDFWVFSFALTVVKHVVTAIF